jgi:hypothetical protein
MTEAPLAFHQPHSGGRILLMLGEHQVGAVFPPPNDVRMIQRRVWFWRFWLPRTVKEGRAGSEQAAGDAILAAARDWLKAAGMS